MEKSAIKLFGTRSANNHVVAVSGIVYDPRCSYLIFNGIDYEENSRGANELLLYKTIAFAQTVSEVFDFEGSMIHNIESFYRKFGAELTPFMRITRDNLINYAKTKFLSYYKKIKYGK